VTNGKKKGNREKTEALRLKGSSSKEKTGTQNTVLYKSRQKEGGKMDNYGKQGRKVRGDAAQCNGKHYKADPVTAGTEKQVERF